MFFYGHGHDGWANTGFYGPLGHQINEETLFQYGLPRYLVQQAAGNFQPGARVPGECLIHWASKWTIAGYWDYDESQNIYVPSAFFVPIPIAAGDLVIRLAGRFFPWVVARQKFELYISQAN